MLVWSKVPAFPRQPLVLGVLSLIVLCGVQFRAQPTLRQASPRHAVAVAQPSSSLPPQRSASEQLTFGGIGAYVTDVGQENRVSVVQCLEGTPAFRAGLQAGDVIEKIDGRETGGLPLEQAVALIRGAEGTKVRLSVYRSSTDNRFELDLRRARIHAPSHR